MRFWSAPATALFVFGLSAATAFAETRPIRGEIIKSMISGGTIQLDTPIGAKLPLSFAADGTVTGTSIVLAFYLGSTTDHGRWWISGNKLCTKFSRWFDREQSCLVIRPDGFKFAWTKDDGDTGTASIISNTQKLYGQASALTGGVSAAALVRNAEERAAAAAAREKTVQMAALSAPPPVRPTTQAPVQASAEVNVQRQTAPEAATPAAIITPAIFDDPRAWLPVSAAWEAAKPVEVAMTETVVGAETVAAPAITAPQAPASFRPPQTYKVAGVTPYDVLNVRSNPQPDADIVGTIPPGAHGVVVSGMCQADWCPVSYQKQSGWVSHQFLKVE